MRIIAGSHKGNRIEAPSGRDTRPTSDRVREAIFSTVYSLFGDLDGLTVLDLYAGSGALGIESLSRGAARCVFVESDRSAAAIVNKNLERLGLESEGTVLRGPVERAAASLAGTGASLLLADPPYRIDASEFSQVLEVLARDGAVRAQALIVYEHSSGTKAGWPRGFVPRAVKRYGDTGVSFATYEG